MARSKDQVRALEVKISKDTPLTEDELTFLREEIQHTTDMRLAGSVMSCFQWLNDPANIPLIEPYLHKGVPYGADCAVWTLCWLGHGQAIRDYMIYGVEPGFAWDTDDELAVGVPYAVGHHLRTHTDRDLAQLLVRWRPRMPGDPFLFSQPCERTYDEVLRLGHAAAIGMGYAVGADPLALTDDQDLVDTSVKRFLAERQDG